MRKHFLVLILSINTLISFSQEKKTEFGIKLGMNYISPSTSEVGFTKLESEVGVNFGIFFNYSISNKLVLIPELVYSTQNLKTIPPPEMLEESNQKETYINLPLLVRYSLNEKLSFLIGPQIGYNINNDKRLILGERRALDGRRLLTFEKASDRIYYSGNLGLNLKINKKIGTEIRYNFGLAETNGFKNSVLQLNFDYTIW